MATELTQRLFTVSEYYRMAGAGILHEDDRVELIEGKVIEMAAIGSRHASTVKRLNALLQVLSPDRAIVGVQDAVRLDEYSEPQPDLSLLRPRLDFYREGHPKPDDVFLLIEVADSSSDYDHQIKLPLYARAGIVEVWIVDLETKAVGVYRQPSEDAYALEQDFTRDEMISPEVFPDPRFAVAEIFG
jgi:Uma2 family endonuclease